MLSQDERTEVAVIMGGLLRAAQHDERERRKRWELCLIILALLVTATIACLRPVAPPQEAAMEDEEPPAVWSAGSQDAEPASTTRTMPDKPFKGQARPPCPEDSVSINGGCWSEMARKPGVDNCGRLSFAHEGKCYVPVRLAHRPPTSAEE